MMRRRAFGLAALSLPLGGSRAMAPSAVAALNGAGVTFSVPSGWATEDDADGRALFMYRMAGANAVEASMMIELFTDKEPQSPERSVDLMIESVKTRQTSYRELKRDRRSTAAGLRYAFAQFEVRRKGAPFLEQYAVFPVEGSTRVNIFSSFDRSLSSTYLPAVEQFLQSLRVAT